MQILTRRRVPALAAAAIAAIAPTTAAIAAPTPADATASALLDAFATHQIVALGQVHDLRHRSLPRTDRIQMRLGDPDFDWSKLRRAGQLFRAGARRDTVFASTAEREARAGRHVLLLSGVGHFLRSAPGGPQTGNALERLERGAPGRVWTVLAYGGVPQRQDDFERRFIGPQPLTGELGDLPATRFLPRPLIPSPGLALRNLADALLSFGPCAQLRFAKLSRAPFRDRAYRRELDRRNRILFGWPFVMPVLPSPNAPYCPGSA